MKTTKEIANDIMIAEFMGLEVTGPGIPTHVIMSGGYWVEISELQYKYSFEWLIPVWKRINSILMPNESFRFTFAIRPDFCYILDNETDQKIVYNEHGATEEELVYITICEFIEWYNENKQL